MWIGESFVGDGPNAAHVNTVLGGRDGGSSGGGSYGDSGGYDSGPAGGGYDSGPAGGLDDEIPF